MAFDPLAAMKQRTITTAPSIVMIDLENIEPNKKNFYRVSDDPDIERQNEQLKATIEMYGVAQPLVVKALQGGKYRIRTGERRYLACCRLTDEGKPGFKLIPCIVKNPQSDEDEQMELIVTNHHRDKSLAEKIEEVKQLTELLEKKKARGDKIPGRMNEIIAEMLNISKAEVGRLRQIDKNLQPEFKEAIKQNKLAMMPAVELAKLSSQDQKAVYEKTGGKVTAKEVKKYREEDQEEKSQNLNIDGFEPLAVPKKPIGKKVEMLEGMSHRSAEDIEHQIFAVITTIETLKEKKMEAEELQKTDEITGNTVGTGNRKALVEYLDYLIEQTEKDLFELQEQKIF